jgi:hypothetical protein
MTRLVLILFVLVSFVLAVWLYPFDCDAAFAVHDAIWYGLSAERDPRGSINPHHPLFHGSVWGLTVPLRKLGVEGVGHVASRLVAWVGAACLLLQLCAAAGRRRILVGAAFAFVLFSTRGFLVEMASGENVLPAAAASLLSITLASRANPRLWPTAGALALALLLRQDNLFSIPGVAAIFALGRPAGMRLRATFGMLCVAGLITIAGYAAAWWINCGGREGPIHWMLRFGREGSWTGPKHFTFERMPVYVSTFATAVTGRLWPLPDDRAIRGLAYLFAFLVPGLLLRGTTPNVRIGIPIAMTLAARAPFHWWYEADNFEWLVLPVAFVLAFAANLARGEPATSLWIRRVGIVFLIGLGFGILWAHGLDTWKLRERKLMLSVEQAVDVDRARWRFLVDGGRTGAALSIMRIPYLDLSRGENGTVDILARLQEELERRPVPTTVIADRFVMDGMPHTARSDWPWPVDQLGLPGWQILRRDGRAFAGRWTPPQAESSPTTRSDQR